MRTWRATKQQVRGRTYWSLQTGKSGPDRVALALGFVTEGEAQRALEAMQKEEVRTYGTPLYDRVLRLYAEPGTGKEAARRYLIGDPSIDELFPVEAVAPDHKSMALRDYVDKVYGPARATAKPATWRTEQGDWDLLLPLIGNVKLRDVDEHVVADALDAMKGKRGAPASPNMRRKARNAVSSCLTYARRHRHYSGPMPNWFRIEGTGTTRPEEGTTLTLDEVQRLIASASPMHGAVFACCAGLGLRPNEGSRLRWEDINFEQGTVKVRGTKTDLSAATVPLLPLARVPLERWWELQGRPTSGPCFIGKRGPYRVAGSYVPWRKALHTAASKAGIGHVTPYDLRHTAATLLVQAGVPIASVAKLLRHSNPRMVERHYDHSGAVGAAGLEALAPRLR